MKLSIIVPFFNADKHIDRCIYSLVNQGIDFNNYEIILINDGSTDGSKQSAENHLISHPNNIDSTYKYLQLWNGIFNLTNTELTILSYFIDADDYLTFNVLEVF